MIVKMTSQSRTTESKRKGKTTLPITIMWRKHCIDDGTNSI